MNRSPIPEDGQNGRSEVEGRPTQRTVGALADRDGPKRQLPMEDITHTHTIVATTVVASTRMQVVRGIVWQPSSASLALSPLKQFRQGT
jgi:hypothetical protein